VVEVVKVRVALRRLLSVAALAWIIPSHSGTAQPGPIVGSQPLTISLAGEPDRGQYRTLYQSLAPYAQLETFAVNTSETIWGAYKRHVPVTNPAQEAAMRDVLAAFLRKTDSSTAALAYQPRAFWDTPLDRPVTQPIVLNLPTLPTWQTSSLADVVSGETFDEFFQRIGADESLRTGLTAEWTRMRAVLDSDTRTGDVQTLAVPTEHTAATLFVRSAHTAPDSLARVAAAINDDPIVESVRETGVTRLISTAAPHACQPSEGLAFTKLLTRHTWNDSAEPGETLVVLIDSGISQHSAFVGHLYQPNAALREEERYENGGLSLVELETLADEIGHGTGVAGAALGKPFSRTEAASGQGLQNVGRLRVLMIKVASKTKGITLSNLQLALQHAARRKAGVVNISIESPRTDRFVEETFRNHAGLIVVAAGNDGMRLTTEDPEVYPAAYAAGSPHIIAVAALEDDRTRWQQSNYGVGVVEIAAPGKNVLSTYSQTEWRCANGTSYAAPFVSFVAAVLSDLAETSNASSGDLKQRLLASCRWTDELAEQITRGCVLDIDDALSFKRDVVYLATRSGAVERFETDVKNGTLGFRRVGGDTCPASGASYTLRDTAILRYQGQGASYGVLEQSNTRHCRAQLESQLQIALDRAKCDQIVGAVFAAATNTCTINDARSVRTIIFKDYRFFQPI
jgi:subtilisin family serine protease